MLNKILDKVFLAIEWLCILLYAGMVIVCTRIFVGRYIFKITPAWGEPLAMLFLVWLCILSSALAVKDDDHIKVTMLDNVWPEKVLIALNILSIVIVFLFAIFMVHSGYRLAAASASNNVAGINISFAYYNAALPVAGIAYFCALLKQLARRFDL